jgi:hypothetical protein
MKENEGAGDDAGGDDDEDEFNPQDESEDDNEDGDEDEGDGETNEDYTDTIIRETQHDDANAGVGAEVEAIGGDVRGKRKSAAGRKVKSQSPAISSLSRDSSVENSPTQRFEKDSILLVTRCIEAVNEIAPVLHGPKPTPFLYWPRHKDYLCAMALIRRCPDLTEIAEKHYMGVTLMAKKWESIVKTKANNERAVQIRYLKIIWLSKRSNFHMAYNALESEIGVDDETEIMLSPAVIESGITSVSELRELIKSPAMYKNEVVFNLFCLGLESGMLKMARPLQPTRLQRMITVAHEAHFRLELWLALMKQGFRHKTTAAWNDKRKEYWDEFCKLVAADRKDHEETASLNRLGLNANQAADPSDDEGNGHIDPDYF